MKTKKRLISYEAKVAALKEIAEKQKDPQSPRFVQNLLDQYMAVGGYYFEGLFSKYRKLNISIFRLWREFMLFNLPYLNREQLVIIWNSLVMVLKPSLFSRYNMQMPAINKKFKSFKTRRFEGHPSSVPDIPPGNPEYYYGDEELR